MRGDEHNPLLGPISGVPRTRIKTNFDSHCGLLLMKTVCVVRPQEFNRNPNPLNPDPQNVVTLNPKTLKFAARIADQPLRAAIRGLHEGVALWVCNVGTWCLCSGFRVRGLGL